MEEIAHMKMKDVRYLVKNRATELFTLYSSGFRQSGVFRYLHLIVMTIIRTKIYDGDFYWFQKYSNYIQHGNVLKVGYGLGYASYFIQLFNGACTSVDIVLHPGSVRTKDMRIYDGKLLPFQDHSFDSVLCVMTLHHIDNWEHIFLEMLRITRKNIIIVEETHDTIWQKLFLVYNCWLMNTLAGQRVDIHWSSYLSAQQIEAVRKKYRLRIRRHVRLKTLMFFTELFVFQKTRSYDAPINSA